MAASLHVCALGLIWSESLWRLWCFVLAEKKNKNFTAAGLLVLVIGRWPHPPHAGVSVVKMDMQQVPRYVLCPQPSLREITSRCRRRLFLYWCDWNFIECHIIKWGFIIEREIIVNAVTTVTCIKKESNRRAETVLLLSRSEPPTQLYTKCLSQSHILHNYDSHQCWFCITTFICAQNAAVLTKIFHN